MVYRTGATMGENKSRSAPLYKPTDARHAFAYTESMS